ncbi:hypothetical protein VULLAG_LOCUS4276 [Vulpes lagopus]
MDKTSTPGDPRRGEATGRADAATHALGQAPPPAYSVGTEPETDKGRRARRLNPPRLPARSGRRLPPRPRSARGCTRGHRPSSAPGQTPRDADLPQPTGLPSESCARHPAPRPGRPRSRAPTAEADDELTF